MKKVKMEDMKKEMTSPASKVGDKFVIPWDSINSQGVAGRPSSGAVMGVGKREFNLEPTDEGLEVERVK